MTAVGLATAAGRLAGRLIAEQAYSSEACPEECTVQWPSVQYHSVRYSVANQPLGSDQQ